MLDPPPAAPPDTDRAWHARLDLRFARRGAAADPAPEQGACPLRRSMAIPPIVGEYQADPVGVVRRSNPLPPWRSRRAKKTKRLLFTAAPVAERRRTRGLTLNYPRRSPSSALLRD